MLEDLDEKQYIKFLELIAKERPLSEFQIRLGMSVRDVHSYKEHYRVRDAQAANDILHAKDLSNNRAQIEQRRKELAQERKEAQAREDAMRNNPAKTSPVFPSIPNNRSHAEKVEAWNKHLAESNIKPEELPSVDEEQFRRDSTKGWRFLTEKYSLDRKIILGLLNKFKINSDLLLR